MDEQQQWVVSTGAVIALGLVAFGLFYLTYTPPADIVVNAEPLASVAAPDPAEPRPSGLADLKAEHEALLTVAHYAERYAVRCDLADVARDFRFEPHLDPPLQYETWRDGGLEGLTFRGSGTAVVTDGARGEPKAVIRWEEAKRGEINDCTLSAPTEETVSLVLEKPADGLPDDVELVTVGCSADGTLDPEGAVTLTRIRGTRCLVTAWSAASPIVWKTRLLRPDVAAFDLDLKTAVAQTGRKPRSPVHRAEQQSLGDAMADPQLTDRARKVLENWAQEDKQLRALIAAGE